MADHSNSSLGTMLPAITLWQPWATLIAAGAKPFEFRSWPAPRRLWGKRVAIHAGARPVRRDELQELLLRLRGQDARETGLLPQLATAVLERASTAPGGRCRAPPSYAWPRWANRSGVQPLQRSSACPA